MEFGWCQIASFRDIEPFRFPCIRHSGELGTGSPGGVFDLAEALVHCVDRPPLPLGTADYGESH